jgi:hypothetical protein
MGVPSSEVGYTSATTGRGAYEVHNGHVVALKKLGDSSSNSSIYEGYWISVNDTVKSVSILEMQIAGPS